MTSSAVVLVTNNPISTIGTLAEASSASSLRPSSSASAGMRLEHAEHPGANTRRRAIIDS